MRDTKTVVKAGIALGLVWALIAGLIDLAIWALK